MARMLRSSTDTENSKRLPAGASSPVVTDESNRITNLLRTVVAEGAIGFEFDGKLQVNIDVRKREDVLILQTVLPQVEGGLFRNPSVGHRPNRSFGHRMSAEVSL